MASLGARLNRLERNFATVLEHEVFFHILGTWVESQFGIDMFPKDKKGRTNLRDQYHEAYEDEEDVDSPFQLLTELQQRVETLEQRLSDMIDGIGDASNGSKTQRAALKAEYFKLEKSAGRIEKTAKRIERTEKSERAERLQSRQEKAHSGLRNVDRTDHIERDKAVSSMTYAVSKVLKHSNKLQIPLQPARKGRPPGKKGRGRKKLKRLEVGNLRKIKSEPQTMAIEHSGAIESDKESVEDVSIQIKEDKEIVDEDENAVNEVNEQAQEFVLLENNLESEVKKETEHLGEVEAIIKEKIEEIDFPKDMSEENMSSLTNSIAINNNKEQEDDLVVEGDESEPEEEEVANNISKRKKSEEDDDYIAPAHIKRGRKSSMSDPLDEPGALKSPGARTTRTGRRHTAPRRYAEYTALSNVHFKKQRIPVHSPSSANSASNTTPRRKGRPRKYPLDPTKALKPVTVVVPKPPRSSTSAAELENKELVEEFLQRLEERKNISDDKIILSMNYPHVKAEYKHLVAAILKSGGKTSRLTRKLTSIMFDDEVLANASPFGTKYYNKRLPPEPLEAIADFISESGFEPQYSNRKKIFMLVAQVCNEARAGRLRKLPSLNDVPETVEDLGGEEGDDSLEDSLVINPNFTEEPEGEPEEIKIGDKIDTSDFTLSSTQPAELDPFEPMPEEPQGPTLIHAVVNNHCGEVDIIKLAPAEPALTSQSSE